MGDVSRVLPTTAAPTSLRAAAGEGVIDWRVDDLPASGAPDDGSRWQRQWSFRSAPCLPVQVGPAGCAAGDSRPHDPSRPVIFTGAPFAVEAQVECSTASDGDALVAEARAAFERGVSPAISTELYRGAVARSEIDDGSTLAEGNRWLTRSDDPVSALVELSEATDGVPLVGAVGLVESYLATCADGGRGVIHVPPALLAAMTAENLLIDPATPSGRRYSPGGHLVVADAGYTGEAPGTASEGPQDPTDGVLWIYATGPMVVRVSPLTPIGTDEEVAELLATTNDRIALAQGVAMVAWGCCHGGVPVDVTPYGLDLVA